MRVSASSDHVTEANLSSGMDNSVMIAHITEKKKGKVRDLV
jgi:hypothetical protein